MFQVVGAEQQTEQNVIFGLHPDDEDLLSQSNDTLDTLKDLKLLNFDRYKLQPTEDSVMEDNDTRKITPVVVQETGGQNGNILLGKAIEMSVLCLSHFYGTSLQQGVITCLQQGAI